MAWAYGSYVTGRFLVLLTMAVLARLLTPEDFGLVALALTFIAFLEMVSDLGMSEALIIVGAEDVESKAHTAFTVTVLMALVLGGAAAALGPLAAGFFDEAQLKLILPVLGATFLLRSLGATHSTLAQKRLDFRARTVAQMADVIVRGATGISLALAGAGAWALVAGYVVGTLAWTVTLWAVVPWRPRPRIRRDHLRELLRFGTALTGISIVAALTLNIDKLAIGRTLGPAPLGLYALASRLPELLIINLTIVAGTVLFPAFAAVDRDALGRAFLTSLRYAVLLVVPLGVLLGVLAEPALVTAFGEQWRSATGAMQLFTLMAALSPFTQLCGTLWKARGRARFLLRLALLELATLVPAVLLFVDDGITAVAACQAGSTIVVVSVSLPAAARMVGVRAGEIGRAVGPPVAAGAAMAAVLVAVHSLVSSDVAELMVGGLLGTAVYLVVVRWLARDTMSELWAAMAPRLRRTPPPEPQDEGEPTPAAILAADDKV